MKFKKFFIFFISNLILNSEEIMLKNHITKDEIIEQKELTSVKLDSDLKFVYNKHLNADYSTYEKSIKDPKDTFDTDKNNDFFYSEYGKKLSINSKFVINFYDDIDCFIPFGLNYMTDYPKDGTIPKEDKMIDRELSFWSGISLSWPALENLNLSIKGDLANSALFIIENRLFKSSEEKSFDTLGRDIKRFGLVIKGDYKFKFLDEILSFNPDFRLRFNSGREIKKISEIRCILTPVISIPFDVNLNITEDFKFKFSIGVSGYMNFLLNDDKEDYSKDTNYENSGIRLDLHSKILFIYNLFNIIKFEAPIEAFTKFSFANHKSSSNSINKTNVKTALKASIDYDLVNNLSLISESSINWIFFTSEFNKRNKIIWPLDPRFNLSLGIRYSA